MILKNTSRKISSLVIDSNAQLRFGQPFAILILAIFATINFIFWQIFSERSALSSSAPPEVLATLNGIMGQLVLMCSLGMVLIGLLALILWIVYSHRIFGPQVKLRRQIANLMKGDYDYKISLRKNDEFKDLADDLNKLAEHLKLQTKV